MVSLGTPRITLKCYTCSPILETPPQYQSADTMYLIMEHPSRIFNLFIYFLLGNSEIVWKRNRECAAVFLCLASKIAIQCSQATLSIIQG